jgi:hypothetical protein
MKVVVERNGQSREVAGARKWAIAIPAILVAALMLAAVVIFVLGLAVTVAAVLIVAIPAALILALVARMLMYRAAED